MANNSYKDSDNRIPSGLASDIMRMSMENKNLLKNAGSMYVGTGTKTEAGTAITKALEKGENGTILAVDGNGNLGYTLAKPEMFTAGIYNIITARCKTPLDNVTPIDMALSARYAEYAKYYEKEATTTSFTILGKFEQINGKLTNLESIITDIENKWPTLPVSE